MIVTAVLVLHVMASRQEAWVPPLTSLPADFVQAVQFVIEHGFANPRGGKFSVASVKQSETWSGRLGETKVRGWVMPSQPGQKPTIVLPNGLAYPVESIIRGADVNEGLGPVLGPNQYELRGQYDMGVAGVACLLLTGNTSLAEKRFAQISFNYPKYYFTNLATEMLANRYHRAVEAHMRGDDRLAMRDSFALQKERGAYEAEAVRILGQKYFDERSGPNYNNRKATAFSFLDPVDSLVDDSRRRLDNPRPNFDLKDVVQMPVEQRLPKLIKMLDQVNPRQFSQPGGVDLISHPISRAIVAIGPSAGEALLDTIEFDKRLTRAVSFGRDFFPDRNLKSVSQTALTILKTIAKVDQFQEYGQPMNVGQIRKFWTKYGAMTPEERWLNMLKDDSLAPRQWTEAAGNIVDRREFVDIGGMRGYRSDKKGPMHGESLRSRSNPTVSELMAKRARTLYDLIKVNSSEKPRYAMEMAMLLYKWDAKASLPVLRDVSRQVIEGSNRNREYTSLFVYNGPLLTKVLESRFELGDNAALLEYCDYLVGMSHNYLNIENAEGLRLLAKYLADPQVSATIKKLFLDEDAAWNVSRPTKNGRKIIFIEHLVNTPLIVLPPVREGAKALLTDKTVAGNSWVKDNQIHTQDFNGGGSSGGLDPKLPADLYPPPGEIRPFRHCDQVAMYMSNQLTGAPKFQLYWPAANRDRAISEMVGWLDRVRYEDLKDFGGRHLMWERDDG